ncbi:MAG: response regulator transcription factor [Pseudomonadota bacterium]
MKIVLIDDHAVVREGYRALISRQSDMEVAGEFADAGSAYSFLLEESADIAITDLNMPGLSALEMIERLRQRKSSTRVLVFTMYSNINYVTNALNAGAKAYVTKSSDAATLLHGVREVKAGRQYLSADVAQRLALEQFGKDGSSLDHLTVREFEILRLLVTGRRVDEIAEVLNLSPKTVRNVHYNVKKKLEVRDDIELVRRAIQLKIISPAEI